MNRNHAPSAPDLRMLDFGLVAGLEALIEERHVSRAAARLGITQPAMSSALARLRILLGDPLLIRSGQGMVPTSRALALLAPVKRLLAAGREVLSTAEGFEPTSSHEIFRLIGTDYMQIVVLPPLLEKLELAAPGVNLLVRPANPMKVPELLANAQVDLGIGFLRDPPGNLHARLLLEEPSVCVARRPHPALNGRISLDQFCRLSHVRVTPSKAGIYAAMIDEQLNHLRVTVRSALTVPGYLVAPAVAARTNLLAIVPKRVALVFAAAMPLQLLEPPIPIPPLRISLYWHDRSHRDPRHRWLRGLIAEIGAGL